MRRRTSGRPRGRARAGATLAALALGWAACAESEAKRADEASAQHASRREVTASLEEPPLGFHDRIWSGDAQVTRAYYDDAIAVYVGAGVDPVRLTWMYGYVARAWQYVRATYGWLGSDPRLYVVVHSNLEIEEATISTHSGEGFGQRNVIDLGTAWDWSDPTDGGLEVITHELAHVVEWGAKNVRSSPSYGFWDDGPWPAIFVYDVYRALGHDDLAAEWRERMLPSTSESQLPELPGERPFFGAWFYPIYAQYGQGRVFERYFALLAECFPKHAVFMDGKVEQHYDRDATPGEVLHFFSGATGADLTPRFREVFGWSDEIARDLAEAQRTMRCADTYAH